MRHENKDDKLFIIEDNTDMSEGYLRRMKGYVSLPKASPLLAVAFGYKGKLRISNAVGYMKTFRDVKTPDDLSTYGTYSCIAVYYVVENLDDGELPLFLGRVKQMLRPDGCLMVVMGFGKKQKMTLGNLARECKAQGLNTVASDLWKREPLNYWDHDDRGKTLTPWQKRLLPLHRRSTKTVSLLLSQRLPQIT